MEGKGTVERRGLGRVRREKEERKVGGREV